MYRVEDKYICDEPDMALMEARIAAVLEPDQNQAPVRGYCITSVYFDDLFDSHLADTYDGNPRREKYRIRIYNGSLDMIKLEVKIKKYNRVMKKSAVIDREQMRALLAGDRIEDNAPSLDSSVTLFNLAIRERGLRPKVIVEYDRNAYIYEAGNVRITFDRNIRRSFDIDRFDEGGMSFENLMENDRVLEVKYDEFLPQFIGQLLESNRMNQSSCSKYRLCREKEII